MQKRCESHNLAVGPDGYCALCRSRERARRTPRLALILAVVALVPTIVASAMFFQHSHQAEAVPFKPGVLAVRPGIVSVEQLPSLRKPLPEGVTSGPLFHLAKVGGHPNAAPHALAIWVTRDRILVNDKEILRLPPKPERANFGTGASNKRSGARDLFVVPVGNEIKRVRQSQTDAILYVDETTEFRLLAEVMFTLSQSGLTRCLLATELPSRDSYRPLRSWVTNPPGLSGPGATRRWIAVLQLRDGTVLKSAGENIAPGCAGNGPGVTLPNQDGHYDFTGLTACAESLGKTGGKIAIAYITANPSTPYEALLRTIQAMDVAGIHNFAFKVMI